MYLSSIPALPMPKPAAPVVLTLVAILPFVWPQSSVPCQSTTFPSAAASTFSLSLVSLLYSSKLQMPCCAWVGEDLPLRTNRLVWDVFVFVTPSLHLTWSPSLGLVLVSLSSSSGSSRLSKDLLEIRESGSVCVCVLVKIRSQHLIVIRKSNSSNILTMHLCTKRVYE